MKLTIDNSVLAEDFFSDTKILGIVAPVKDYRFCWLLNERFALNLAREAELDIVLQTGKGNQHFFPVYQYCLPLNGYRHLLYRLRSDKETLLPEIKQLDYLWMIQSNDAEEDARNVTQHLRNIPDVQLAQVLSHDRLKNLNSLLV